VVLLPPLCLDQDESELADILRHELQHVARHDFIFNQIAALSRALLFFHPATWFAMRQMGLESELACDLAVVGNSPERRGIYAECLVRFARLHAAQDPTPWNLEFAGSAIQLKVRIRSVLAETAKIPAWRLYLRGGAGMLLFAGFLCVAPSLFIVISYAHTIAPMISSSPLRSQTALRPPKKSHLRDKQRDNSERGWVAPATPVAVAATTYPSATSPAIDSSVPQKPETLLSGEPIPTLQMRTSGGVANRQPARATVIFIANPNSADAGSTGTTKGRSIASAVMTGASEAARFAGSHGKDVR
jgi:hypothetical protein